MSEESEQLDYIERTKQKGKLITRTIVIVNLVLFIIGFITIIILDRFSFGLVLGSIWTVFIFSMIYFGRRWAKWFFVLTTVVYLFTQVGLLLEVANELNREYSFPITDEIRAEVPEQVTDEWLQKYLSPYPEYMPEDMLASVLAQIPEDIVMPEPISDGFIVYVFVFAILEIVVSLASVLILIFSYAVNEFLYWQKGQIQHRVNY